MIDQAITPAMGPGPMPIITQRLLLRPLMVDDAAAIYEAVVESWAELSPWLVWTLNPLEKLSVADYAAFCQRKQDMYAKGEDITLLSFDRRTQKLVGGCGLHHPNREARSFSLGFWVRTSETKKGYATEVAQALSHYAFEKLSAHKLVSCHAEGNNGSGRVLRRAGFTHTGIQPNAHKLLAGNVDEHQYILLPPSPN